MASLDERWCISAAWSLILIAWDGPASYLHSQFKLCFSAVLSEDSSCSDIVPSGSSLQLGLLLWHVHAPPGVWQKMHLCLGEHRLGCLRLMTSVTPKISLLLPETGNFALRNAVPVSEQGEFPEPKTLWTWCCRWEVNFWVRRPAAKEI